MSRTITKVKLPEIITLLAKKKSLKISEFQKKFFKELSEILKDFDTKIAILQLVRKLRMTGVTFTPEQYVVIAKSFCPEFWTRRHKIDPYGTICLNCGPGAVENCVTHGKREIAEKLVL